MIAPPVINIMAGAARKAARGLLRDFGEVEQLQVSLKGPADFVSAADRRVENLLRRELRKARPEYSFLCEESGPEPGTDTANQWVIDPLDGTTNFLHGIPHFAISIALVREGDPIAGVVYNPISDELYWAEKGSGAFVNERRLRVSARRQMDDAVFATGFPYRSRPGFDRFFRLLEPVIRASAGVRRFGSAALDLAYVAAGRVEGFWEVGLQPWDIAAGIVLVREAGGYVSEIYGGRDVLQTGNILAANDHLHTPLGELLRSAA